jgi:hypothetical protein
MNDGCESDQTLRAFHLELAPIPTKAFSVETKTIASTIESLFSYPAFMVLRLSSRVDLQPRVSAPAVCEYFNPFGK